MNGGLSSSWWCRLYVRLCFSHVKFYFIPLISISKKFSKIKLTWNKATISLSYFFYFPLGTNVLIWRLSWSGRGDQLLHDTHCGVEGGAMASFTEGGRARGVFPGSSGRCSRSMSWATAPRRLFLAVRPSFNVFRCQILEGRNRCAVTHPGVSIFLVSDWSTLLSSDWV